jgi:hypothetical protein
MGCIRSKTRQMRFLNTNNDKFKQRFNGKHYSLLLLLLITHASRWHNMKLMLGGIGHFTRMFDTYLFGVVGPLRVVLPPPPLGMISCSIQLRKKTIKKSIWTNKKVLRLNNVSYRTTFVQTSICFAASWEKRQSKKVFEQTRKYYDWIMSVIGPLLSKLPYASRRPTCKSSIK